MCRTGGRRCEHNWTGEQRAAVNARRRANYRNRTTALGVQTSQTSAAPEASVSPPPEIIISSVANDNIYLAVNDRINLNLEKISQINENLSRQLNTYPAEEYISTMVASTDRVKSQIKRIQDEISAIGEKVSEQQKMAEGSVDEESLPSIYSEIEDLNKQIITKQALMQRQISKLDERERLFYGLLSSLTDEQERDLRHEKYEASADITKAYPEQIAVIGPKNVDLNKVNYSDHASMKCAIMSAGIKYPTPTYWDEMGSSAKDEWEERQIAALQRQQRH